MSKDKDRRCFEFGSGTRRRPIGLDYGEAKDAAFDKLPSTCSGPELVERQVSQRWGKAEARKARERGKESAEGMRGIGPIDIDVRYG